MLSWSQLDYSFLDTAAARYYSARHSGNMTYDHRNPLIVQGDRSVLAEVDNPRYAEARDAMAPFAELEKSPEHIHTYRLTPLSLWNAAAAGMTAEAMIDVLSATASFRCRRISSRILEKQSGATAESDWRGSGKVFACAVAIDHFSRSWRDNRVCETISPNELMRAPFASSRRIGGC